VVIKNAKIKMKNDKLKFKNKKISQILHFALSF